MTLVTKAAEVAAAKKAQDEAAAAAAAAQKKVRERRFFVSVDVLDFETLNKHFKQAELLRVMSLFQ